MSKTPDKLITAIRKLLAAAAEVERENVSLREQQPDPNPLRLVPVPDGDDQPAGECGG